jgi:glucan 1,3-beta-glucosidase
VNFDTTQTTSPQPWITPSLFDNTGDSRIIDEWTFCQYQDRTKATATLKAHWNTWITEADFAAIAAAGYISFIHV